MDIELQEFRDWAVMLTACTEAIELLETCETPEQAYMTAAGESIWWTAYKLGLLDFGHTQQILNSCFRIMQKMIAVDPDAWDPELVAEFERFVERGSDYGHLCNQAYKRIRVAPAHRFRAQWVQLYKLDLMMDHGTLDQLPHPDKCRQIYDDEMRALFPFWKLLRAYKEQNT